MKLKPLFMGLACVALAALLAGCSVPSPVLSPAPSSPPSPEVTLEQDVSSPPCSPSPDESPAFWPPPSAAALPSEIEEKYLQEFYFLVDCLGTSFRELADHYDVSYIWYNDDAEIVAWDGSLLYSGPIMSEDSYCVAASEVNHLSWSVEEILDDLQTEVVVNGRYRYIDKRIGNYRFTFLLDPDENRLADGENTFVSMPDVSPSPQSVLGAMYHMSAETDYWVNTRTGTVWDSVNTLISSSRTDLKTLKQNCASVSAPTEQVLELLYFPDPESGFLDLETGIHYFEERNYLGESDGNVSALVLPASAVLPDTEIDTETLKGVWSGPFMWFASDCPRYAYFFHDAKMLITSDINGVIHEDDLIVIRLTPD